MIIKSIKYGREEEASKNSIYSRGGKEGAYALTHAYIVQEEVAYARVPSSRGMFTSSLHANSDYYYYLRVVVVVEVKSMGGG